MEHFQMMNYLELSYIVINETVSVDNFKDFFHLSSYKYKTDIEKITEMSSYFGIHFNFSNEKIMYRIIDNNLFTIKKDLCSALFTRYYNNLPSNTLVLDTVLAIKLLNAKSYVTVTELAESLGYSKSNIRNRIKWAREFLKGYNIKTKNTPHHGIYIEGNEFYKRLCMISLNGQVNTNILIDFDEQMIIEKIDSIFSLKLQDIINQVFHYSSIISASVNINMLKSYLIISNWRMKDNYKIAPFENFSTEIILLCEEYEVAQNILTQLYPTELNISNEIVGLAIYLLILKEYYFIETPNQFNFIDSFKSITENICQCIQKFFNDDYHVQIIDYSFTEPLKNAIMKLVIKDYFQVLQAKSFSIIGRRYASAKNPLANKIMIDLRENISPYFSCTLPNSQIHEVMNILERFIQSIDIDYKKRNILILTKINPSDSFLLYDLIKKKIPSKYYGYVQMKNLNTELVDVNAQNDIIITDVETQYTTENKDIYFLDQHYNSIEPFVQYLRYQRELCHQQIQQIYVEELNISNIEELQLYIMEKLHVSRENLLNMLIFCNDLIFIVFNHDTDQLAQLWIEHLHKPLRIEKSKYEFVIIIDFQSSIHNISLIDLILKILANKQKATQQLYLHPSIGTLNFYINEIYD